PSAILRPAQGIPAALDLQIVDEELGPPIAGQQNLQVHRARGIENHPGIADAKFLGTANAGKIHRRSRELVPKPADGSAPRSGISLGEVKLRLRWKSVIKGLAHFRDG